MKDFDGWNEKKKHLHEKNAGRFYHVRDIWWCALGVNVGFEQDGKNNDFQRPVLIVKEFGRETCLIAPLTTSKHNHKYRIDIGPVRDRRNKAILSQIKVIDTKRLINRISVLDKATFEAIKKSIRNLF